MRNTAVIDCELLSSCLKSFEFLIASDHTMVQWKYILKFLPVCFFQKKNFKKLYKPLYDGDIIAEMKKKVNEKNFTKNIILSYSCLPLGTQTA